MKIKVFYSKSQLEACVKFVSDNNQIFYGNDDYIRQSIHQSIQKVIEEYPTIHSTGTIGYMVEVTDFLSEGFDSDENKIYIEFSVDPALNNRNWMEDDYMNEIVEVINK